MNIKKYRDKIDNIDKKIVLLIDKRMDMARKISIIKKNNRLKIEDKQREKEVLKNVTHHSKYKKEIKKIYSQIIKISKMVQKCR